jgi:hypothetical protein
MQTRVAPEELSNVHYSPGRKSFIMHNDRNSSDLDFGLITSSSLAQPKEPKEMQFDGQPWFLDMIIMI